MNNFQFPIMLNTPQAQFGFVLLIIWSLVWKGMALWRSARNGKNKWFFVLLIFNTLGILEIIYLLFIDKTTVKTVDNTSKKV